MGIPQWIMIIIFALSLAIGMAQHGKPKEGKENFFFTLVGTAITFGILLWGGFFTK